MPFGDVPQFKVSEHIKHQQYNCPPRPLPWLSLQAPCEGSGLEERDRPRAGRPEKRFHHSLHLYPQVCILTQAHASQLTNRDKGSMGARNRSTWYNGRPIEPGDKNGDHMLAREDIVSTWSSQRGVTGSRNKKSLQNPRSVNRSMLHIVRAYMHAYM